MRRRSKAELRAIHAKGNARKNPRKSLGEVTIRVVGQQPSRPPVLPIREKGFLGKAKDRAKYELTHPLQSSKKYFDTFLGTSSAMQGTLLTEALKAEQKKSEGVKIGEAEKRLSVDVASAIERTKENAIRLQQSISNINYQVRKGLKDRALALEEVNILAAENPDFDFSGIKRAISNLKVQKEPEKISIKSAQKIFGTLASYKKLKGVQDRLKKANAEHAAKGEVWDESIGEWVKPKFDEK